MGCPVFENTFIMGVFRARTSAVNPLISSGLIPRSFLHSILLFIPRISAAGWFTSIPARHPSFLSRKEHPPAGRRVGMGEIES